MDHQCSIARGNSFITSTLSGDFGWQANSGVGRSPPRRPKCSISRSQESSRCDGFSKGLGPSLSPYRLSQFHLPEDIIRVVSSERQEASPQEKNSQEQILFLDNKGSSLDLCELGQKLFQMGICSVLVEGGGITFSHFLTQKAADRLILFYGTKILGNPSGISWTQALRGFTLKTCPEMESPHLKTLGNNIMVSGRLKYQT